jgi:hypothetical protein
MKAIAEQCEHFSPFDESMVNSQEVTKKGINCTMCRHYDNENCNIIDDILVNMDQT